MVNSYRKILLKHIVEGGPLPGGNGARIDNTLTQDTGPMAYLQLRPSVLTA